MAQDRAGRRRMARQSAEEAASARACLLDQAVFQPQPHSIGSIIRVDPVTLNDFERTVLCSRHLLSLRQGQPHVVIDRRKWRKKWLAALHSEHTSYDSRALLMQRPRPPRLAIT